MIYLSKYNCVIYYYKYLIVRNTTVYQIIEQIIIFEEKTFEKGRKHANEEAKTYVDMHDWHDMKCMCRHIHYEREKESSGERENWLNDRVVEALGGRSIFGSLRSGVRLIALLGSVCTSKIKLIKHVWSCLSSIYPQYIPGKTLRDGPRILVGCQPNINLAIPCNANILLGTQCLNK